MFVEKNWCGWKRANHPSGADQRAGSSKAHRFFNHAAILIKKLLPLPTDPGSLVLLLEVYDVYPTFMIIINNIYGNHPLIPSLPNGPKLPHLMTHNSTSCREATSPPPTMNLLTFPTYKHPCSKHRNIKDEPIPSEIAAGGVSMRQHHMNCPFLWSFHRSPGWANPLRWKKFPPSFLALESSQREL